MKNLITRSITGLVFVFIILGSLLLGKISYAILFAGIIVGALIEFYSFFKNGNYKPSKIIGYVSGFVLFLITYLIAANNLSPQWIFCLFPFLLLIFVSELYSKKSTPIENIAISFFSFAYLAVPISLINFLVFPSFDDSTHFTPDILIAVLATIWIYDSSAYMVGVNFGKHRLLERVSPKKSWEGAIGGAIIAIAFSYVISLFIPEISLTHWIVLAALIVVSATFGDLTESLIKRTVGVKDSSNLFPGHGGILDRFDSLLFAIPVVVLYLKLFIE